VLSVIRRRWTQTRSLNNAAGNTTTAVLGGAAVGPGNARGSTALLPASASASAAAAGSHAGVSATTHQNSSFHPSCTDVITDVSVVASRRHRQVNPEPCKAAAAAASATQPLCQHDSADEA